MSETEKEGDLANEPEANQLRELLRAKAKDLQDEAIRSGGLVSIDGVEALRRLSNLVEISDAQRPKPSRRLWLLITAFALTLLIASILLFVRPKNTTVEMDLRVDEVSFALSNR